MIGCSRKKDPLGIETGGFSQDTATIAAATTVDVPKASVVPSAGTVTNASVVSETQGNPLAGAGAGAQSASAVLAGAVQRERQRQQSEEVARHALPV
jgi:hypothetical protein